MAVQSTIGVNVSMGVSGNTFPTQQLGLLPPPPRHANAGANVGVVHNVPGYGMPPQQQIPPPPPPHPHAQHVGFVPAQGIPPPPPPPTQQHGMPMHGPPPLPSQPYHHMPPHGQEPPPPGHAGHAHRQHLDAYNSWYNEYEPGYHPVRGNQGWICVFFVFVFVFVFFIFFFFCWLYF